MIKINLYNIKVSIKIFDDFSKMQKFYISKAKKLNIELDEEYDYYSARTIVNPLDFKDTYLLFIKDQIDTNTIAHEIYHLTNRIIANQGITLDPFDDENGAIINGFLNEEVVKYLLKKKIEIK